MTKVVTKKYIKEFVLDNLESLSKKDLKIILNSRNIYFNEEWKKEKLVELIKINKFNMMDIYNHFKKNSFGINKKKVKNILNIDDESFEYMINTSMLKKSYVKKNCKNCKKEEEYYSLEQLYKMSLEGIYSLKYKIINEKNKSTKREKTVEGKGHIKKARENMFKDLMKDYKCWKSIVDNKDEYVILAIDSPTNVEKARSIEISIINFQEEEIYYANIKKSVNSIKEINGVIEFINEELSGKKILMYDKKVIDNIGKKYKFSDNIEFINIMELYMNYRKSKFTIRLERALNFEGIKMAEIERKAFKRALNIKLLINGVVNGMSLKIKRR